MTILTLEVQNLSCTRQHKSLFHQLCFQVTGGELLIIEGRNGAGKSSLLRLLAGLTTPQQGTIFWNKESIETLRSDYYQYLHYLGHANGLKLGLSVNENLLLQQHLLLASSSQEQEILDSLQLSDLKHVSANFLSAGQKRKLALAKLLLFPKPLWILDEPLTALDVTTQHLFLFYLEKHLQQQGLCIMSSHQAIPTMTAKTLRLGVC